MSSTIKHNHQLTAQQWNQKNLYEQFANIGAEVGRSFKWKNKQNTQLANRAFTRALELIDLSLACNKQPSAKKELARLREIFVDHFFYENKWRSTEAHWDKYFFYFSIVANKKIING